MKSDHSEKNLASIVMVSGTSWVRKPELTPEEMLRSVLKDPEYKTAGSAGFCFSSVGIID